MNKTEKIFVAGHKGMVGSAICRALLKQGYSNIITATKQELNLIRQEDTKAFFEKNKPDYVFLSAAKVGGILANATQPADFIYQNLTIQNNIIHYSYEYKVKRLLFLGSSCIYPKECPQPIKETYLLTGQLEPTNSAYAIAKIAGIEMCRSYNTQYNTRFLSAMPTNLYGINDNYDSQHSHVFAALIKKIHYAITHQLPSVEIWGSGNPMREFLCSDDLANACLFLMNLDDNTFLKLLQQQYYPLINVGYGKDISIKNLALLMAKTLGYKGDFIFDTTKPDGTMKKLMDSGKINKLGWQPAIDLEQGIDISYQDFIQKKLH